MLRRQPEIKMKKLPIIASIGLYMYLTVPTSSLVAAPRDGFCNSSITEVKDKMLAQGNKVISSKSEKISNASWKSARVCVTFYREKLEWGGSSKTRGGI
jgi:hypothetical protein